MVPNLDYTLSQLNISLEKRINTMRDSTSFINKIKQNNVKLYKSSKNMKLQKSYTKEV